MDFKSLIGKDLQISSSVVQDNWTLSNIGRNLSAEMPKLKLNARELWFLRQKILYSGQIHSFFPLPAWNSGLDIY